MEEVVNLAALEGSVDFSMFGMFLKSDWVVKLVIILLVIFSIQSWKIIIQKILLINKQRKISKQFENSLRFDTDGHITSIHKMGLYTNERNLNTGEKLHSFKFPSLYETFGFSSEISFDGKIEHSLSNPFPTLFDKQVSLSVKAPQETFLKNELEMRGGPGASMWHDNSFSKELDLNENQGVELSACFRKSCIHFKY